MMALSWKCTLQKLNMIDNSLLWLHFDPGNRAPDPFLVPVKLHGREEKSCRRRRELRLLRINQISPRGHVTLESIKRGAV
ncbi:hypothetical protein BT93_A1509 [Corymbia citriodora subsp. variegata]|nr:hypothetical protein BT93_A1509 [Corymbia citriodora subsp. variegata]